MFRIKTDMDNADDVHALCDADNVNNVTTLITYM